MFAGCPLSVGCALHGFGDAPDRPLGWAAAILAGLQSLALCFLAAFASPVHALAVVASLWAVWRWE